MSFNRAFLIRIEAYNRCLMQTNRLWSAKDLMKAASDDLHRYGLAEGRDLIGLTTFKEDRDLLRSGLYRGRPINIVVFKKKYYKYQLPEMALDNIHLSDTDIDALQNLMPFEPYLRIFDLMDDALNLLKKIEELKKKKMQLKPVIDFDFSQKTTDGLQWLPLLYKAIFEKQCIDVPYNPFSREKKEGHGYKKGFSPWRLKQNRHRWYVMGWCEGRFDIMGLERMQEILPSLSRYVPEKSGYIDSYFKNLIGITKPDDDTKQVDVVSLRFTGSSMQYIRSKMLHWSMRIDSDTETELVVSMDLQINYELVSLILSYGEMVEVLAPEILREKIRVRLRKLSVFYGL